MFCPECGFRLDPLNESQVVCPACGADPNTLLGLCDDPYLAAALEDGEAFAEAPVTLSEVLGDDDPMEPEIDYVPDPVVDLAIADARAMPQELTETPILVAGNTLIN
ncbi:MAG: hypothetical protein ABSH56_30405 [Bryobacteraceae bacterium]|jgi:hypothetical protein